MGKRFDVSTPRPKGGGFPGESWWCRVGSAWQNDKGLITIYLDSYPVPDEKGVVKMMLLEPKPQQQTVVDNSVSYKEALNDNIPFKEALMVHEDLINQISAMHFPNSGKYAAKLDFDQRCEILALYRSGVGRSTLAMAYGLDRRTITHTYNGSSNHYRAVREEERKLGPVGFLQKYITENALANLKAVQSERQEPLELRSPKEGPQPKRSATKYAGVHLVKTSATDFEHRIVIAWQEAELDNAGPGWYYQDADGASPDAWLHNGDESRLNSHNCLQAVKENLVDI